MTRLPDRFALIEAARVAREAAPPAADERPVRQATWRPTSGAAAAAARVQASTTVPPETSEPPKPRAPRSCGTCGSLDHDARFHRGAGQPGEAPVAPASAAPEPRAVDAPGVESESLAAAPPVEDGDPDATPAVANLRTQQGRIKRSTNTGKPLSGAEKRAAALIVYPDDVIRPQTREECRGAASPSPIVSSAHHRYNDMDPDTGAIKLNFPHLEVWQMAETCALDVADRGGITLEEVGAILNLTRERIRQVEVKGLGKLRKAGPELAEADIGTRDLPAVEDRIGWR